MSDTVTGTKLDPRVMVQGHDKPKKKKLTAKQFAEKYVKPEHRLKKAK